MIKLNLQFSKIVTLILNTALIAFTTSCGKEVAPDPPRSESKLVIELFNSLKDGDNSATLKKIDRLRVINPESLFLANLEATIKSNLTFEELNKVLEEKDLANSIVVTNKLLKEYNGKKELISLDKDLAVLADLDQKIKELDDADGYKDIFALTKLIELLAKKIEPNANLNEFLHRKTAYANEKKDARLEELALFDLALDIDFLYMHKYKDVWNDIAALSIEDPDSPIVHHYMDVLNGYEEDKPFMFPAK